MAPTFQKTRVKKQRERFVLTVLHLCAALDMLTYFGSLTYFSSDFRSKVLFSNWAE